MPASIVDPHVGASVVKQDVSNLQKLVQRYLDKKQLAQTTGGVT